MFILLVLLLNLVTWHLIVHPSQWLSIAFCRGLKRNRNDLVCDCSTVFDMTENTSFM